MQTGNSLTARIQDFMRGNSSEVDELFREIMPELFRVASWELRSEGRLSPVTKTELIGELYVRHLSRRGWRIENRHHFYALAGQAMRHVLCDLARARFAKKSGSGDIPTSLDDAEAMGKISVDDDRQTIEIGLIMESIQRDSPDVAEVIDLCYFWGLTLEQAGAKLGISARQARGRWSVGKKRILKELQASRRKSQVARASASSRSLTTGAANSATM
jgi:RNA polymerase sigma factor (TIGR02999 family)